MRFWTAILTLGLMLPLGAAEKLTEQDRIELMRGLLAEYATVKQYLPRSRKALPFETNGTYDKILRKWHLQETAATPAIVK